LGEQNPLAVKTDGTLWAWGSGDSGRLGDGTVSNKSSPVQIGALANWAQVSAGYSFCAAVKTDGTLWAWGGNGSGQLGQNDRVSRSSPVQVGALTNWTQAAAGSNHIAAITKG
jgi:alpha-tubulin suppressor-like RCC1 family protein